MSRDPDHDSLAEERTALARGRTGLALLACGAAVVKGLPSVTGLHGRPATGGVILALASVWTLHGLWNGRRRRRTRSDGRSTVDEATIRAMAMSTVILGLGAFVVGLLS